MLHDSYKVAVPYEYKNPLMGVVQEFNIEFDSRKSALNKLIEFIETYPDTRINIHFPRGVDIATVTALAKMFTNVYFRLDSVDMSKSAELVENGCHFFFNYDICAFNYTVLDYQLTLGVSDIYIADDLWYNLTDVAAYCQNKNVGIRLVLNRIPSTTGDKGTNPKTPLITPEDLEILDQYITTYEFDCGEPANMHRLEEYMKIWFDRGYWHGNIQEINGDLKVPIHNDMLMPSLWHYKSVCDKRCCKRVVSNCRKCEQWWEIAKIFNDKGFIIKEDKKQEFKQ